MHAERDHLVTVAFPELRERVEQLGLEFFDVDLRWGVPTKDANGETANSWEYCRQWIDRVEPFFVCILGQRYGHIPKAQEIRDEADRRQYADLSITEMEIRHAVLSGRLNRRSFFYFRKTLAPESAPREIRDNFVEHEDKVEKLKRVIREGARPVCEYPCQWTGNGFTRLEEFGERVLGDLWSGVLRDERYVSKDVWRQVLGTAPDSDPRYTDESQLVPHELWEKIVALAKPKPKEPLEAEREQMETFAHARLRWFQGRTKELAQLTDFIHSSTADDPRLAVVAAAPGQGKSALLAKLHQQLSELSQEATRNTEPSSLSEPLCGQSLFLITHFVGATESSASAHSLVERLLGEFDRSGITWPVEMPVQGLEPKRDFNSLCLRLAQRLGDYAGKRRIVILLDALNQLSDGHDLQWLPLRLGPSVRVIISCVRDDAAKADSPEHRVLNELTSRQPAPLCVPLGPLAEHDVRTIVIAYLKEYCHELDREHLDQLCAITQARNPLYLIVMLNELRTLGGNELNVRVPQLIAELPARHPDTVSLFEWGLQKLENAFTAEAVSLWCLYLTLGRAGMTSHELADLLARKLGEDAAATALRIERGLRRYLQRRGPQLDFFHSQLREAAMQRYGGEANIAQGRCDIADYFEAQEPMNRRKAAEWPWQLQAASLWDRLERAVTDIPLFLILSEDPTKWELARYWQPLRALGRDMASAYIAAYEKQPSVAPAGYLLLRIGNFLMENGSPNAAVRVLRTALNTSESWLGPQDGQTISTLISLAYGLRAKGDYVSAEAFLRQVLETCYRVLGTENPYTFITLDHLAGVLADNGDYAQAESVFTQAVNGLEATRAPDDPHVLTTLNNFACFLMKKGDYSRAESLLRRALEKYIRKFGKDHPSTIISQNNLAIVLQKRGAYDEAEPLCRNTLERLTGALGPDHPDTLVSMNNLASILRQRGAYAEAEHLNRTALVKLKQVLGSEHPTTLNSMNTLATLLLSTGHSEKAEALLRQVLASRRDRVLGPDHPDTLNTMDWLASLVEAKGDCNEAQALYRQVLEGWLNVSKNTGRRLDLVSLAARNYATCLERAGMSRDDIRNHLKEVVRPFSIDYEL